MLTSLDQLLRCCQETNSNSASLSEISNKKKKKQKKTKSKRKENESACCTQMFCSASALKPLAPAGMVLLLPSPTHVLIMSTCVQLRRQAHLDLAQYAL